jgi:methyltransferase-like protein 23
MAPHTVHPPLLLPLTTQTIPIAGRAWLVRHVADQDALIGLAEGRDQFPFGLMLWESGVALATWLATRHDQLDGITVLELGAGVGLPGLIAASLGARVTQTDHDGEALALARANAELNDSTGIETAIGDWFAWTDPRRYDLILGADIVYDGADHAAILALFERVTSPGGRVVLTDPGRERQAAFAQAAHAAGWHVATSQLAVADLRSRQPGATLTITLLILTRHQSAAPPTNPPPI